MSKNQAPNYCWQTLPGVLAWPHEWQRPARTEEWAFESGSSSQAGSIFSQLVCFPWATLVDLLDRGHLDRAKYLLEALADVPPRAHLIRATVFQHIRLAPVLSLLKDLQITDVFWAHARTSQASIDGIRLHPFPLYPVRALDCATPLVTDSSLPTHRRYLYSFIGAYCPKGYLSPVRRWISEMPHRADAYVVLRKMWHYEAEVYGEQIGQHETPQEELARIQGERAEYDAVLGESVFSLCPSGSGPNSIRLWESLGFGCIPVLLSDSLRLPGSETEWNEAIVRIPESREATSSIPSVLSSLMRQPDRLLRMQQAGRRLWLRYCQQGPANLLAVLSDPAWVRARLSAAQPG